VKEVEKRSRRVWTGRRGKVIVPLCRLRTFNVQKTPL